MADYNISVPLNEISDYAYSVSGLNKTQSAVLTSIKATYGSIIDTCASNSNVPAELITAMIYAWSNGVNSTVFKARDDSGHQGGSVVRSGLCSLSNYTARLCLHNERVSKRLSTAEKDYLNKYGNDWVKMYIADEQPKSAKDRTVQKWYGFGNGVQIRSISDAICLKIAPFNFEKPEVSIAIGTIMLGQAWDTYGERTNKPIGAVIASLLLPLNDITGYPVSPFYYLKGDLKMYNTQDGIQKLPAPNAKTATSPLSTGNVMNPNGGWVGTYMSAVLSKGGALEKLVKKSV